MVRYPVVNREKHPGLLERSVTLGLICRIEALTVCYEVLFRGILGPIFTCFNDNPVFSRRLPATVNQQSALQPRVQFRRSP